MARRRFALAGLALLAAACEIPREPEPYATVPITPFLGTPVLGDKAAPVELVEYASTTCGHCAGFHEAVFPRLKEKYVDTGKLKLAWVVLPTPPDAISLAGAAIARCAGEARFFEAIDALFDAQDKLMEVRNNPWRVQQELRAVGARLGLSSDQVGTCIDDPAILETTRAAARARPQAVTGTPSFVIGGVKLEVESLEALSAAIDAELAKAQPVAPAPPT